LLAGSAEAVRQQNGIADLEGFVVDFGADGADDAGSFVAEDCGRVT